VQDDMMQKIMDTYSPTENYGIPYTELIINWLFLLVFASIHTTTENATMVMYWLLKHPQYTQELLHEQEEVVGSRGANGENLVLTFDDLKKLVKLDSFIREVLRLRTVDLALHHKNISGREVELSNGTCVPAGELVYVNSWDISRNVALQGEDAEEFRPWRYVETNKQAVKIGEDHITFGIGK
jgi:cytochrome P450